MVFAIQLSEETKVRRTTPRPTVWILTAPQERIGKVVDVARVAVH